MLIKSKGEKMKVVIIGAVAAGSKCAAKLKRDNPKFEVEIYTEEDKSCTP